MNKIVKLSFVMVATAMLFSGYSHAATSSVSEQAKTACYQKHKSTGDNYYNCTIGYDLGKAGKSKNSKVDIWNRVSGSTVIFATECSKDTACSGGYDLGKAKNSDKASTAKKVPSPTPKAIGKAAADAGKSKKDACSRYKDASNKKQCEQAYDAQAQAKKKKESGGSGGASAAATKAKEEAESKDPALDCINNRDRCNLIKKYINPIIAFLTAAVGIAVTIGIISGGIRYASAGDDPGKMNAAKKQIGTALVALFALLVLYAAIRWITPNVM